jgi:hypothetical protein
MLGFTVRPGVRTWAGATVGVLVFLLGAGCTGRQTDREPPPRSAPPASARLSSTAPPTSSKPPHLARYSQAELAKRPCDALDAHDLAAVGVTGHGKEERAKDGKACAWQVGKQHVSLQIDAPLSYARTMAKGGRVSQVPVGQHAAVQAEFQRICFIFVGAHSTDHLVSATAIPDPGAAQDGVCPAGASVVSAALSHIR